MESVLLKNGQLIDVVEERIRPADVLIRNGLFEETADHISPEKADRIIDCTGKFIAPGFTDSHLHIESSMLTPVEFCRNAMLHGTCTVMADPHEITNVAGLKAVKIFMELADMLPFNMLTAVPSCVPATDMEHSGAELTLEDTESVIDDRRIYGLGEMMNFPGIINGFGEARAKVDLALSRSKPADGHCPGLRGSDLKKYISSGKDDGVVRISSDHETSSPEEALEKLEAGIYLAVRYGSATKDMDSILPAVLADGRFLDRVMLCSDDLSPAELLSSGHMDRTIRRCCSIIMDTLKVSREQAAVTAIKMATLIPGRYLDSFHKHHGLPLTGAVVPGYRADAVILDSLDKLNTVHLICGGKTAVENGKVICPMPEYDFSPLTKSIRINDLTAEDFHIPCSREKVSVRTIDIVAETLLTETCFSELPVKNGFILPDPEHDIAMISVFERHHFTGSRFSGFVKGLGIREGAIASTIAHDSHNLIIAGFDPEEMAALGNAIKAAGGGIGFSRNGNIKVLPLEAGGLMTAADIETVAGCCEEINQAVKEMGSGLKNIFMTMSFLALPVIPELKITDMGLIDVNQFKTVPLFE